MDAIKPTNDFVGIHYQQSGKSTNTNAMGMRILILQVYAFIAST